MRAFYLALCLACISSQSAAQSGTGSLEGRVRAFTTGESLAGVEIDLRGTNDGARVAGKRRTDAEGHFRFLDVPLGNYSILATQAGKVSVDRAVTIEAGESVQDFDYALFDSATIRGRVVDPNGKPLERMTISVWRWSYLGGYRVLSNYPMLLRTDNRGEFETVGLPPDEYFIQADYQEVAGTPGPKAPIVRTYYPGVADFQAASPIVILEGVDQRADFRMQAPPTRKISGSITPPRGTAALSSASFLLIPRNYVPFEQGTALFNNWLHSRTAPEGVFELRGVQPGSYDLLISVGTANRHPRVVPYTVRTPIEIGSQDIGGLKLVLNSGVDVRGKLVIEKADAPGNPVHFEQMKVVPFPKDLPQIAVAANFTVDPTDPSGAFVLKNLPAGSYTLRFLNLPRNAYLADLRGTTATNYETASFTVGDVPPAPLEIVISTAGATLEGTAVKSDRKGLTTSIVALVPEPKLRANLLLYKSETPDRNGKFVFRGIAPGKYKVFAWESIPGGAYANAEYLKQYEAQGQEITFARGESATLQVNVIPARR